MAKKRFILLWRNKFLLTECTSLEEMAKELEIAAGHLRVMFDSGKVFLEDDGGIRDDYAHLYTHDKNIAEKYGFVSEKEFYGEGQKK